MANERKRDLVREYKERKQVRGVFAVRCTASGEAWVSASPNLDTQQNGLWFQLRMGNHMNKPMQAAANPIVTVADLRLGNDQPLALIAGPCALESRQHALEMAAALKEIAGTTQGDVETIQRTVRRAAGRFVNERTKRKPMIVPVVMEA